MKKILLMTSFAGLFTFASAFDTKYHVGVTAGKIDNETYTQFGVGYTASTKFDNDVIFGFGNSLSYGNVKSSVSVTTVDMDAKLGYELIEDLTGYGIGTGAVQFFDNSTYTGLGYGAALEYRINPNMSLEGSYKTMHMSKSNHSYDYDTTKLAVKFGF